MASDLPEFEISSLWSDRLLLKPLAVEHSDEMALLLDDPLLHTYTGGEPVSAEDLRAQYAVQSNGRSDDGTELWFNWIVRRRADNQALGYVQATVTLEGGAPNAEIAWVIGSRFQKRGHATDAAQLMVDWLRVQGVRTIAAHVHPDNAASRAVASHLGLHPTARVVDGETRWED